MTEPSNRSHPDPERFQVGDPRRAVEQQRKNQAWEQALLAAQSADIARAREGCIDSPDRFAALREGWRRSSLDRGPPYRAEALPARPNVWIVVDRLGGNCWTRDTGHVGDSRRQVAEAVAAAWNDEANETLRSMT